MAVKVGGKQIATRPPAWWLHMISEDRCPAPTQAGIPFPWLC